MRIRDLALAATVGVVAATVMATSYAAGAAPAPVQAGTATLTPQNTKIQFVCAHVGAKPDPRKGGFAKFSGTAKLDSAAKSLKSLSVEIDTTSLFTEFDMLTNHLKSPDFFEVRRFPSAKFESTKIEPGAGTCQITGKLTLHGVTKEISFPASVEVGSSGVALKSEFTIDRTEFGMTYDPKKVENKVTLAVLIGEKA
jgi:polyisoprenoid-binding protein YceI